MMRIIKGVLRVLISAVLILLCAALFYVLVIMGDTLDYASAAAQVPAVAGMGWIA